MAGFSASQKTLADKLFACGAVQFGQFKLKLHEQHPDAPRSPIFFNLRTPDNPKPGPLDAELVRLIATAMAVLIKPCGQFNHVAGVPRAGDPFARALANIWHCSQLYLTKTETAERRSIADLTSGSYHSGDTVLVIDDLITAADSKLEAIGVFTRYGLRVEQVVVLLDRQQGGREQLAAAGVRLHAVFTVTDLVEHYATTEAITQAQASRVFDYLALART